MALGVFRDRELERIVGLPRRPQTWDDATTEKARDLLTQWLKTPNGTMRLNAIQARMLVELHDVGALCGPMVGVGAGKAQPLSEPVHTPGGFVPMGSLKIGDKVTSTDGAPSVVTGIYPQGRKRVFKITFSDGAWTRATGDHLWATQNHHSRTKGDRYADTLRVMTTEELKAKIEKTKRRFEYSVPILSAPAKQNKQTFMLAPYTIGVLLGDGGLTGKSINISCGDSVEAELLSLLREKQMAYDSSVSFRSKKERNRKVCTITAHSIERFIGGKQNRVRLELDRLGLMGKYSYEKRIPSEYLLGSSEQRLELLQGILDTDGTLSKNGAVHIDSSSIGLIKDVIFLVRSIGGVCSHVNKKQPKIDGSETSPRTGIKYKMCYRISIKMPSDLPPVLLKHKVERLRNLTKYKASRYIESIKRDGYEDCQCISVSHENHLYITRDFIVTHNTKTTFLAPIVVGAKRTVLLVPASLRVKTIDDFEVLKPHYRGPNFGLAGEAPPKDEGLGVIVVLSYESLSSVRFASWLDEFDPDLIIADEAHALSQITSGRSKRLFRFIKSKRKRGEELKFIPLTGSGLNTKLSQVAHLMEASLGKGSPLPTEYESLRQWGAAIDTGVRDEYRLDIGALSVFTPTESIPSIESVRRAIRDRILDTPGIIATKTGSCEIPLILRHRPIEVPGSVRHVMRALRDEYRLPSGDPCEAGITFWNHAREIANGFCYRWDPPPPMAWREARTAWVGFVREAMRSTRKIHLDTPLQVWNACESGHFGRVPEWEAWKAIRDTFKPNTVPDWISDYLVKDAEAWATKSGGIVWVSHSTAYTGDTEDDRVGARFETIPYFGAGDERIKSYKGPCAASVRAHGVGKSLQQWSEALIMGFPSSNKTLEQLIGRLHRPGQSADVVTFNFYAHSLENLDAVQKCLSDAAFVKDTTGADQRILNAHILDENGHRFDLEGYKQSQIIKKDPLWT